MPASQPAVGLPRLHKHHLPSLPPAPPPPPSTHGASQVRNAASLAYTALLVRMLGFRNHAGKVGGMGGLVMG